MIGLVDRTEQKFRMEALLELETIHHARLGIGSITLDGKTNTEYVYFVDGLKHNHLSVGQLVDKGYQS